MKTKKSPDLKSSEFYINRELSWLEFNDRVLGEGKSDEVPLMERLKFLAIVSSNLDEFFMIRVAGLDHQVAAGVQKRDISGLTPRKQLGRISERVHQMVADQSAAISQAFRELAENGIHIIEMAELTPEQAQFVDSYFVAEILPILTPLAVDESVDLPVLPGLQLNLAVSLSSAKEEESRQVAVVPIPGNLPRFVTIPGDQEIQLMPIERIVSRKLNYLFPEFEVEGTAVFRLTRDADVVIDDDDAVDLLETVEEVVRSRRRQPVLRLELSAEADPGLKDRLMKWFNVSEADLYEVSGLMDATGLMEIANRPGFDDLKNPDWTPQPPQDLIDGGNLWETLQERDVLLFHPYESFEPVISLLQLAAEDPDVLAIKQTLYRTSGDSPIIAALARAAENGKQVTVLVELKARFDEARNVNWARQLENAGCHVIYGVARLKTHAKLLLIVRREPHGIRRYVHSSTGNYNDKTAKLYSDIGFITSERDFAGDASAFFNLLTGFSQEVGWQRFAIAPTGIRQRTIDLIEREIRASTADSPGLIMAKVNSLQDKDICQALYRASQAGVKVRLNIRGICCLRPGVKDVSETIEVVSIIDRYLEHARIFYFQNGGHEEVYLSSADWMGRNLDRRLEIMFPVIDPKLRARLVEILKTFFADNIKARRILPDGTHERPKRGRRRVRAQEEFYQAAVEAAKQVGQAPIEFRPLTKPEVPRTQSSMA